MSLANHMVMIMMMMMIDDGTTYQKCKTKTALPFPEYAEHVGLGFSSLLFIKIQ